MCTIESQIMHVIANYKTCKNPPKNIFLLPIFIDEEYLSGKYFPVFRAEKHFMLVDVEKAFSRKTILYVGNAMDPFHDNSIEQKITTITGGKNYFS